MTDDGELAEGSGQGKSMRGKKEGEMTECVAERKGTQRG